MRKTVLISLAAALWLQAENIELKGINVIEHINSIDINDISGEELKSADLGEALSGKDSDIVISRRSGIANDIILRGQKRDNINVIIDGGKIYGGCPNRMDPPISHIVTSNIESIKIIEGPYDVENFGTLSGIVKAVTKAPQKGFGGEFNFNYGSFGQNKESLTIQGGNDKIKALLTLSRESSAQYEDGSGNKFNAQISKAGAPKKFLYQKKYENMDAYSKSSLLSKLYFYPAKNQELQLSYTANRSSNILYPNTPMDALKDDSDLYSIKYTLKNLGSYSKKLQLLYYYSKVHHPMSNRYRNASKGKLGEVVNDMRSKIYGIRVSNQFKALNANFELGVDYSKRTWDGNYYKKHNKPFGDSINNAVTKNSAIYLKAGKKILNHTIEAGLRYDHTKITSSDNIKTIKYNSVSGYIFDNIALTKSFNLFAGAGVSYRVPDGRELFFRDKDKLNRGEGALIGNPNLKKTKNTEIDLGLKKSFENGYIEAKVFYSKLDNYIYFNAKSTSSKFVNIDAKIYGIKLSGSYIFNDKFDIDYSLTYLRGKKDHPLPNQKDKDLADITPLRGLLTFKYMPNFKTKLSLQLVGQKSWTNYDGDNGEQKIPGFITANLKFQKELTPNLTFTFGIDNIFDKKYQSSNTYNDLTLIATGAKRKLGLNNPGRYVYANVKYSF